MARLTDSMEVVEEIDEATMLEMQKEASLTKEQLEKRWTDKLQKEFHKSEKVARRHVAPTEIPLHDYMHDEKVHTGEGWPSAHLSYEDTTTYGVRDSEDATLPTPQATINIKNLCDLASQGSEKRAPKKKESLSSPPMSTRRLMGSSKTITPPSYMKSVAKGLSNEHIHREEEEEKREVDVWKKENRQRLAQFEGQKRVIRDKMRALEADLEDSDED